MNFLAQYYWQVSLIVWRTFSKSITMKQTKYKNTKWKNINYFHQFFSNKKLIDFIYWMSTFTKHRLFLYVMCKWEILKLINNNKRSFISKKYWSQTTFKCFFQLSMYFENSRKLTKIIYNTKLTFVLSENIRITF